MFRKIHLYLLIVCIAFAISVKADTPKSKTALNYATKAAVQSGSFEPKILGFNEVEPGGMVFLRMSDQVDEILWLVLPNDKAQLIHFQNYQGQNLDGSPKLEQVWIFNSTNPGIYNFIVAARKGQQLAQIKHVITVKGDDGPGPEPEPEPFPFPIPPSKAFILVLEEAGERGNKMGMTIQGLKNYLEARNLNHRIEDKDLKGKDLTPVKWLKKYKEEIVKTGIVLPVLFISEVGEGGDISQPKKLSVVPLTTPLEAIKAIEERIGK